jgi:hypothetical protein
MFFSSSHPSRQHIRSISSVEYKSTIVLEKPYRFSDDHHFSTKENPSPTEEGKLDAQGLRQNIRRLRVSSSPTRASRRSYREHSPTPPNTPVSQSLFFLPTLKYPITRYADSQPFWLTLYFCFNLGLTLYNKSVLVRFPFPYTLTALHALCGSIGGYLLEQKGFFVRKKLGAKDTIVLAAFSMLYAVNIIVSNVSLHMVTVPVSSHMLWLIPLVTFPLVSSSGPSSNTNIHNCVVCIITWQAKQPGKVGIAYTCHRRSWAGVSFPHSDTISVIHDIIFPTSTYGDYYFTVWGFVLTLLGTFLAALKTIFTHILQTPISPLLPSSSDPSSVSTSTSSHQKGLSMPISSGIHLHPLDLLTRMSPLAFIQCVIYAHFSGELDRVRQYSAHNMSLFIAIALAMNGIIAFGLNVVSFIANGKVGAVGICVAGERFFTVHSTCFVC